MTIQRRGTITTWKDDKGFGFITPNDGKTPIFFHVSDLVYRHTRPSTNMTVLYTLIHDVQHRPRAINVRFVNVSGSQTVITLCIVSIFFLLLVFATRINLITSYILMLYMFSSGITYGLYALDKASAIQKEWRIPENTLHFLVLVGGWPGALIAQEYYRHKTVKESYQAQFWKMIVGNLAFLIGYICLQIFSNT